MRLTIYSFAGLKLGPRRRLQADHDLVARTGRVTVVAGDSGSGKSSLLEVIAGYRSARTSGGLIRMTVCPGPDKAAVSLPEFLDEAPARMAFLPQQTILRPFLSPAMLLRNWLRLLSAAYPHAHPVATSATAVQSALIQALFDETERAQLNGGRFAHLLSGGQKRRLDVVLTLTTPAQIILLDEPDTGLDRRRRECLYESLIRFARENKRIIVVVSHHADGDFAHHDVDMWRVTTGSDPDTGVVRDESATGAEVPLTMHQPPPEGKGDRRCLQIGTYLQLRIAGLWGNRIQSLWWLLPIPAILVLLLRGAVYVDPEAPASAPMSILFFYVVACFWLGALQAGSFWAEEHVWFRRECLQGVSSFSYVAGFVIFTLAVAAVQSAVAAGAVLLWKSPIQSDFWRVFMCGWWSAANGILTGLFLCSLVYWLRRRTKNEPPNATTAQLCVLLITLACIVYSYPVIGKAPYTRLSIFEDKPRSAADVDTYSDRILIMQTAWEDRAQISHAWAIMVAEFPWLSQAPFHAVWFKGERQLINNENRADLPSVRQDVRWNICVLALLALGCGLLTRQLKRRAT